MSRTDRSSSILDDEIRRIREELAIKQLPETVTELKQEILGLEFDLEEQRKQHVHSRMDITELQKQLREMRKEMKKRGWVIW